MHLKKLIAFAFVVVLAATTYAQEGGRPFFEFIRGLPSENAALNTALGLKADASTAVTLNGTQTLTNKSLTSPTLTGVPIAPTATFGTSTTQIATTEFVGAAFISLNNSLSAKADLNAPTFTGDAKAVTAAPGDNDTSVSTTAFVTNAVSTKANIASPQFTGDPQAVTALATDNDTSIATTAFSKGMLTDYDGKVKQWLRNRTTANLSSVPPPATVIPTTTFAGTGTTSISGSTFIPWDDATKITHLMRMQQYTATMYPVSGGTGYTNGDVLTLVGGTGTAATYTATVSGGAVTFLTQLSAGSYTTFPSGIIATTGGTGTGCTTSWTGISHGYTDTSGNKQSTYFRYRFATDAPEFEIVSGFSAVTVSTSLIVDNEQVWPESNPLYFPTSGGRHYSRVQYGPSAPTEHYYFAPQTPNYFLNAGGTGWAAGDSLTVNGGTGTSAITLRIGTVSGGVASSLSSVSGGDYTAIPTWNIVGGGTGYALNNVVTISGGTFTAAATATVTGVSGGVVTQLTPTSAGTYTVFPTGTLSTTGGAGTGLTVSALTTTAGLKADGVTAGTGTGLTVWPPITYGKRPHFNKVKYVEVITAGSFRLQGITVGANYRVHPIPVSPRTPRIVVVGDSQTNGTWIPTIQQMPWLRIGHRLGCAENTYNLAVGGSGWVTGQAWSNTNRRADMISLAGDIYFFIGSQNDADNTTTRDAVTTTVNAIQAALPKAICIGVGPVNAPSTNTNVPAGWANVTDQSRTFYITTGPDVLMSTSYYNMTTDAVHETYTGMGNFMDHVSIKSINALQGMFP